MVLEKAYDEIQIELCVQLNHLLQEKINKIYPQCATLKLHIKTTCYRSLAKSECVVNSAGKDPAFGSGQTILAADNRV